MLHPARVLYTQECLSALTILAGTANPENLPPSVLRLGEVRTLSPVLPACAALLGGPYRRWFSATRRTRFWKCETLGAKLRPLSPTRGNWIAEHSYGKHCVYSSSNPRQSSSF